MEAQEAIKSIKKSGSAKKLKLAIGIVGAMIFALVVFAVGVAVGLHKAKFSYQWGQNYERNFMGIGRGKVDMMDMDDHNGIMGIRPVGSMMNLSRNIEGRDFRNAHGLAGTIISILENNIMVKDRDNKESTVAVTEKTIIKDHMADIEITDLKADDQIVVMGKPDEKGVIRADLIRVFCCDVIEEITEGNND